MESYQGVKFNHKILRQRFDFDHRLAELNQVAHLFSQLGLTPVHLKGAYGNQSYRTSKNSFIITKSGMVPSENVDINNYCEIIEYDDSTTTFLTNGTSTPSSESFLHNEIYTSLPHVSVILHGHSPVLNDYARKLAIPETEQFYDYGTKELAQSALLLAAEGVPFFILRDHGFVALGETITGTGRLVLDYYGQLINLINNNLV